MTTVDPVREYAHRVFLFMVTAFKVAAFMPPPVYAEPPQRSSSGHGRRRSAPARHGHTTFSTFTLSCKNQLFGDTQVSS